jgi:hypothetical protein
VEDDIALLIDVERLDAKIAEHSKSLDRVVINLLHIENTVQTIYKPW